MNEGRTAPRAPSSVVILGAGTMGAGMAVAFARAGSLVSLTARRESSLEQARAAMGSSVRRLANAGLIHADAEGPVLSRVRTGTDLDRIDFDVDLVVESIPEDLDEKRGLFRRVEDLAPASTCIASNTSSLPLRELAAGLRHPGRFAGYHWFNPPELVELVEVIAGPDTERAVVRSLADWSRAIGKHPVVLSRETEGFIANRLQYALIREAYSLVEGGICSMEDVDEVVKAGLGPRWSAVGPFETMDLAGLDVHREVTRRLFPTLSNATAPPAALEKVLEREALGAKSGEGLLGRYDNRGIDAVLQRRDRALVAMSSLHAAKR